MWFVSVLLGGCTPESVGDVRHAPLRDPVAAAAEPTEPTVPADPTTPPVTSSTETEGPTTTGESPSGIDVSHWQGVVDWAEVAGDGYGFVFAKATEGTYFTDDAYYDNTEGARGAGLVAGGYHFAIPNEDPGDVQARFFVDNGGGWTDDGATLPGVLDIEWNPYDGDDCYDMSETELISWIADFVDEYAALTGRDPVIYAGKTWWEYCVATDEFASLPLWVADWQTDSPDLPEGWSEWTFWQTSAEGDVAGVAGDCDLDMYAGSPEELEWFARGD